MDALLEEWQAAHLTGPQRQPRRTARLARPMAHEDFVAIEANQVTVKGTPEDVESFALAAGLYGEPAHPRRMSKDEDHILTGVYIGVGLLVAVGAGYLAWRYALSDEQKARVVNSTKDFLEDGVTQARRSVRDARGKVHL